jgi:small GTP-binding protein
VWIIKEKNIQKIRVCVLGKGMVGKSSITYRYINYNTPKTHDPTIEDKYKTLIDIDGHSCEIEILDTAGQDDYQTMIDTWINFGEAFLLVFSITDRESFLELNKKQIKISKLKGNVPVILIGNKVDLANQRTVSRVEAEELAKSWGADYIETSAKVF